ncbi:SDR family NAD(P)-dependent oxidoreductase [Pseudolysinimonas yzui]|uniref:Short-chain dehydrogenase n=1 Tax=Pseudolysinimonas yzui TaxID=2708254 RepID=A0A8J3GQK6_9MICO|nr:SDR family oxidoreductase [Pseudolysinimonas yzui]GHF17009.1 short-chain dehydrogenase [Pseudolysinimonas yzui]
MTIDYRGTTALVTGASSGIGEEFARQLASRGANLVLVARRAERLEALATELRAERGVTVDVIPLDLAAPRVGRALAAGLSERGITIDTVVANAGFGTHERFEDEDGDRIADEIAVNVAAVVDIAHEFYPGMLARGRGALVTVASTGAYQPVPHMAVYGATKAFVLSFTEALWYEARHSTLRVLALSPGATGTEFFDVAGDDAQVGPRRQPVAELVEFAMRTLDRPNGAGSVIAGFGNHLTAAVSRLLPRRALTSLTGRVMKA